MIGAKNAEMIAELREQFDEVSHRESTADRSNRATGPQGANGGRKFPPEDGRK